MNSPFKVPSLFLLSLLSCHAAWSWYPAIKTDMPLPPVEVLNQRGQTIDLRDAFEPTSRKPALLVPVFTRCRMSCPVLVHSLEKALTGPASDAFRVVLLSFDASDTSEDLARFRDRESVPDTWNLVRAKDPRTIREFFDRYSFSIMDSDGGFSHPSQVFVLDRSLKWKGSLLGPGLSAEDLTDALKMASKTEHFATNPEALLIYGAIGLLASLMVMFYLMLRPATRRIASSAN